MNIIKKQILTPIKAIRKKCLDCSCGQYKEVALCPIESCSLWPYRMGKRPLKSEEERLVLEMNLKKKLLV